LSHDWKWSKQPRAFEDVGIRSWAHIIWVRKVLADFEKKGEKQKEIRRKALLEIFKEKGISGSAVLPTWMPIPSGSC